MMGEMISKILRSCCDCPRLTNNQMVDSRSSCPSAEISEDLENRRRFSPLVSKHQDDHRLRSDKKKPEDRSTDPHDQINCAEIIARKALRLVLGSTESGNSDAASGPTSWRTGNMSRLYALEYSPSGPAPI